MNKRAIYGIENTAYYPGNALVVTTYYAGGKRARDKALAALREKAMAEGLSKTAAYSGIVPIRKAVRGEASRCWLDRLIDAEQVRAGDICYRWERE